MNQHTPHSSALRPLAAALAAAGLAAAFLAGCGQANGKDAPPPAASQGAPITAAVVIEKPITETQEFSGRMEAIEHVQVRSRVSGYITEVNFQPGGKVKKGQVLFVIDPRPFQAEADRAAAAASAARAKADLAKIELLRAQKLIDEKAIAQRELDTSVSSFKELDASARAAQAQYDNAKLNLLYTRVIAPIDGRVGKADITLGNLIDTSAILTSVVSDDKIYATFDGDESTYLRVGAQAHAGHAAKVRIGLANETGFPHQGQLEFVDNHLDANTGAVRMRALFANPDNVLVPGLFARVQIDTGNGGATQSKAVLINDQAVGTDQSRKFVYVVTADGKAEYREVVLGQTAEGLRIVRSGLKPGEKIVVNGLQRVRPGAPLAAQIVAMDGGADAKAADAKAATAKPAAEAKVAAATNATKGE